MAAKYHVIQRRNPRSTDEPMKHYAAFRSNGEVPLKKLTGRISKESTVSAIDALAVIKALEEAIVEELVDGNTIRMGDLGSFSINIRSEGSETEEEVTTSNIKMVKVVFRPGADIKKALKTITFQKAESIA